MRDCRTALFLVVLAVGIITVARELREYATQRYLSREIETEEIYQNLPIASTSAGAVRIPIFIYHHVEPDYPHWWHRGRTFNVAPIVLDQELAFLKENGFNVISMDELVKDVERGTTTPIQKPVVLTFDDGWRSQYFYALPILKKYQDTATFYIYSNVIDAPLFLTWDEIRGLRAAGMTIGDHTMSHPYLSAFLRRKCKKKS